jgi:hypothetical protein
VVMGYYENDYLEHADPENKTLMPIIHTLVALEFVPREHRLYIVSRAVKLKFSFFYPDSILMQSLFRFARSINPRTGITTLK